MSPAAKPAEHVHINRYFDPRISLPTLIILAAQAISGVWFASKLDSRVSDNERSISTVEAKAQRALDNQTQYGERLVRIETLMENVNGAMQRVEKKLDK